MEIKALPDVFGWFVSFPPRSSNRSYKHYQVKLFILPNSYSASGFSSLLRCLACSANTSFLLVFHSACPESHTASFAMMCFVLIYGTSYNMTNAPWILAV